MKRKKSVNLVTVACIILFVYILANFAYSVFRGVYNSYDTQVATPVTDNKRISCEGIVFRDEEYVDIPLESSMFSLESGTKVSKGIVIAKTYQNSADIEITAHIEELDRQINTLVDTDTPGTAIGLSPKIIDGQLAECAMNFSEVVTKGSPAEIADYKIKFLELLSKKQLASDNEAGFADTIASLEQKRNALSASLTAKPKTITSPYSGFFGRETDGYEHIYTSEALASFKKEEAFSENFNALFSSVPIEALGNKARITTSTTWSFIARIPAEYRADLKIGSNISINFSRFDKGNISAKVMSVHHEFESEHAFVVFESDTLSGDILSLRKETADIIMGEVNGIRVPTKALRSQDGENGVYISFGNDIDFKLVNVLYQDAEFAVVENVGKSRYLQIYDRVIISDKKLYDTKFKPSSSSKEKSEEET